MKYFFKGSTALRKTIIPAHKLGVSEIVILTYLERLLHDRMGVAISNAKIAQRNNLSLRTVQTSIQSLLEKKLIAREREGEYEAYKYTLTYTMEKLFDRVLKTIAPNEENTKKNINKDFFKANPYLRDHVIEEKKLTPKETVVLTYLEFLIISSNKKLTQISHQEIAKKNGMSIPTAKKAIDELLNKNLIEKFKVNNGEAAAYCLLLQNPSEKDPLKNKKNETRNHIEQQKTASRLELFDLKNLTELGFKQCHFQNILAHTHLNKCQIQNSINAFSYDIKLGAIKCKKGHVAYLIGVLKKGKIWNQRKATITPIEPKSKDVKKHKEIKEGIRLLKSLDQKRTKLTWLNASHEQYINKARNHFQDIEKSELGICLSLTSNEKTTAIYGLAETIFKNDLKKQIDLGEGELNIIWKTATPLKIAKLRI